MLAVAMIATLASSITDEAIGDENRRRPTAKAHSAKQIFMRCSLLVILAISHALFAARVRRQPGGV